MGASKRHCYQSNKREGIHQREKQTYKRNKEAIRTRLWHATTKRSPTLARQRRRHTEEKCQVTKILDTQM